MQPDVVSALLPLVSVQWNGSPIAYAAVLAISGLLYLVMSMSTRSTSARAPAARHPGWIARRRARGGIRHPKTGTAIGYASAVRQVGLSGREMELGGLILGGPGAGKTSAAAVLVESLAWQGRACVVLDPKPSRILAEVVAGVGGIIWTIGGDRQWDALPADPSELANQLVEVLPVDTRTKVYRDAARLWMLVAGQALQRQREHPTVERLAGLCRPGGLAGLLKVQERMADLPKLSATEQDGVLSLGTSLSMLARGTAGPSLGTDAGALRLEDAIARNAIVLLQMAAGPYPEETRTLGAWPLRAMLLLMRQSTPCVLVCDEFARLGVQGRAALELLAMGREFGKPVVLCPQGPSDIGSWVTTRSTGPRKRRLGCWCSVRHARQRHSQSTAGCALGRGALVVDETRDARARAPGRAAVWSASVLEDLPVATAFLRVPSLDGRRTRVEPVRVARPQLVGIPGIPGIPSVPREGSGTQRRDGIPTFEAAQVPPDVSHSADEVDEDLQRVLERLEREGERDGECRLWPASGTNGDGYAKTTIQGRTVTVYKWLYEREYGGVPHRWHLDHVCHRASKARGECFGGPQCRHRRCCELAHLEAKPGDEHSRQRDQPVE